MCDFNGLYDQKHKLASVFKGLFRVVSTTDSTVVVQINRKQERFPPARVVMTLVADDLMRKEAIRGEKDKAQHKRAEQK